MKSSIRYWAVVLLAAGLPTGLARAADVTFAYNQHVYTLVSAAKTWDNAQADAIARNGVLARIDDAAENEAILTNLLGKGITRTASDGGGAVYVWVGGRETAEGTYAWMSRASNATVFWTGGKTGAVQDGLFTHWGQGTVSTSGPEPDNSGGVQNRVGFALEAWPRSGTNKIGQAGQWNDLRSSDVLVYLVESKAPSAPTNVKGIITGPDGLGLTWVDTADDETRFEIWFRLAGGTDYMGLATVSANSTNAAPIPYVTQGTAYDFIVRAANGVGGSDSEPLRVTMPGITSSGHPVIRVGEPFDYTITASSDGATPEALTLEGDLLPGLSFDPATQRITGTPVNSGGAVLTMGVRYPLWGKLTRRLDLRAIYSPGPPRLRPSFPRPVVPPDGTAISVPLDQMFIDPDTERAVRMRTSMGDVDLALYALATPQTVTNFLGFTTRGDYSNAVVHRAIPGFVVQGGGFRPAPPNFTSLPIYPSPTNEPGLANGRGTVAMAKRSGDPNSASSQWFVNLTNNAAILDDQNGGFTVFGRVLGDGMATVDAIAALPRRTYVVKVDGLAYSFDDWPMDTVPPAPSTMDQSKLVLIQSVDPVPSLSYSLGGAADPDLVSATLQSTNLVLTSTNRFGGISMVTVTATDLDHEPFTTNLVVEVQSAYSEWLNAEGLVPADCAPAADPDRDGVPNAVEFALGGSAGVPDRDATLPEGTWARLGNTEFPAVVFRLRKDLAGARVELEATDALDGGAWTPVWSSSDADSPQVVTRLDEGGFWRLTVRDVTAWEGHASRFLRLRLQP